MNKVLSIKELALEAASIASDEQKDYYNGLTGLQHSLLKTIAYKDYKASFINLKIPKNENNGSQRKYNSTIN